MASSEYLFEVGQYPNLHRLHFPPESTRILLATNEAPMDLQLHDIKEFFQVALVEFDRFLEEDIDGVEQIPALCIQEEMHREIIFQYRSVLSPLRRLPTEIIVYIFESVCEPSDVSEYHGGRLPDILDTHRGVWPSSHVCRRWRNIALPSPRLWSAISFNYWPAPRHAILSHLQTILDRTDHYPLAITLSDSFPQTSFGLFLDTLLEHSHHWEVVKLSIPYSYAQILGKAKGRLPLLKRLCVHFVSANPHLGTLPTDFLADTPSLIHLDVNTYSLLGSCPRQLTHLTIADDTPFWGDDVTGDIGRVLKQVSNLRELGIHELPLQLPLLQEVKLASLRKLSLSWMSNDDEPGLEHLVLPRLEELVIEKYDPDMSLLVMIQKSNCSLRSLSLPHVNFVADNLAAFLHATPTVQTLFVCAHSLDTRELAAFLSKLTYTGEESETRLLPMLQNLAMAAGSPLESEKHILEASAFLEMLESRKRLASSARIERVSLQGFALPPEYDCAANLADVFQHAGYELVWS